MTRAVPDEPGRKREAFDPWEKIHDGQGSIEFYELNSATRAESRRMVVRSMMWLLKSFPLFTLVANAHPGEERAIRERVAQVNLVPFFCLRLLWDPSKSRPQRRESISLMVKKGKDPEACRSRNVGRWQVESVEPRWNRLTAVAKGLRTSWGTRWQREPYKWSSS